MTTIMARKADCLDTGRSTTGLANDTFIGGEYHITKDPDQSWAEESSFTWDELSRLLAYKYVSPGTEFALEPATQSTHRVLKSGDMLILKRIVEITVIPLPAPRSFSALKKNYIWRAKKQCRLMMRSANPPKKN